MRAVDHVNIAVDDLDQTLEFYRDVLELDYLRSPEEFEGDHAMFETGETAVTLMATGRADDWNPADLDHPLDKAHLAFGAARLKYERIIERLDGQFPNQGPYDWGEFEGFYFLDPSGNLLEVVTHDAPVDPDRKLLHHDDVEE